jgi:hypothetical protein
MTTAKFDVSAKESAASYVERITNPKTRPWYLRVSVIAMCIFLSISLCSVLNYSGIFHYYTAFTDSIITKMVYWAAIMVTVVARAVEEQTEREIKRRREDYLAGVKSAGQSLNGPNP